MITVKIIDKDNKDDINIKNEPFRLLGRIIPIYNNEKWSYKIEKFSDKEISEMCFPDENYNYDELAQTCAFIGAYDNEKCIGIAILRHEWHKYMYLYDFKVNRDYRGQHIGKLLIEKSKEIALSYGYRGLYTQGQDNNLCACQFYLCNGFVIGGLDTHIYTGTLQQGKKDIIFYCDMA